MKHLNILVTGANGQLGSEINHIKESYEKKGLQFFFYNSSQLDITNPLALEKEIQDKQIDYLINCAAYTAVDKAEDEDQKEKCYNVNAKALKNIGEICKNHNVRVIHVSTDYVFDGEKTEPYIESDQVNPQSVYGKTKMDGEEFLLQSEAQSIIIRTAWVYSIYGNNFVKTMLRLGSERDTLNVVADQYGTPTNARDLAKAILDIIISSEENNTFHQGIYHYSNEGRITWCNFAKEIFSLKNITCKVNAIATSEYPTKAKRPKSSVLDKSKIKKTFNIEIPQWNVSLDKCLKELK